MSEAEKSLVTFALFAYNQERFIREAINGALSQTYSPLQIILSDDCSSDHTFEIMQAMVKDYAGPHTIELNRNERNLGLGGHINRIMELAEGELIVAAAGDDISLPHRTARMMESYLKHPTSIMSISSKAQIIDETGNKSDQFAVLQKAELKGLHAVRREHHCVGCAHAWSRKVFDFFGPLHKNLMNEDITISLRSFLLGDIEYINEVLVLYRRHTDSLTNKSKCNDNIISIEVKAKNRIIGASRKQFILAQQLIDLTTYECKFGSSKKTELLKVKLLNTISRHIHYSRLLSIYPKLPINELLYGIFYKHTYRQFAITVHDYFSSRFKNSM